MKRMADERKISKSLMAFFKYWGIMPNYVAVANVVNHFLSRYVKCLF